MTLTMKQMYNQQIDVTMLKVVHEHTLESCCMRCIVLAKLVSARYTDVFLVLIYHFDKIPYL